MKKFNKTKKILLVLVTLCVVILAPLQSYAAAYVDNGLVDISDFTYEESINASVAGEYHDFETFSSLSKVDSSNVNPNSHSLPIRQYPPEYGEEHIYSLFSNYMLPNYNHTDTTIPVPFTAGHVISFYYSSGSLYADVDVGVTFDGSSYTAIVSHFNASVGVTSFLVEETLDMSRIYTVVSVLRVSRDYKYYLDLIVYGYNAVGTYVSYKAGEVYLFDLPFYNYSHFDHEVFVENDTSSSLYVSCGTSYEYPDLSLQHPQDVKAVESQLSIYLSNNTDDVWNNGYDVGYNEGLKNGNGTVNEYGIPLFFDSSNTTSDFSISNGTKWILDGEEVSLHENSLIRDLNGVNTQQRNSAILYNFLKYGSLRDSLYRFSFSTTINYYGVPKSGSNNVVADAIITLSDSKEYYGYDLNVRLNTIGEQSTYTYKVQGFNRITSILIWTDSPTNNYVEYAITIFGISDGFNPVPCYQTFEYVSDGHTPFSSLDKAVFYSDIYNESGTMLLASHSTFTEFVYDQDFGNLQVTKVLEAEENLDYFLATMGFVDPKDLQSQIDHAYGLGYQEGLSDGKKQGYTAEQVDQMTTNAWFEGYEKGLSTTTKDSYDNGYKKGYLDGKDAGFNSGLNAGNKFVEAFDKIGDSLVNSINIFATSSNMIFNVNLMQIVCTFAGLAILWSYIKKVF